MMYNTVLQPNSYEGLPEAQEVVDFMGKNFLYRYEHEHRKWEYGLALKLIRETKPETVLNVGGGSSPLSSIITKEVKHMAEIDPSVGERFPGITYIVDTFPSSLLKGKFDMVVCTSVIEHVTDDYRFFMDLLDLSNKTIFITTDFHPSGKAFSQAHLRTYNEEFILDFIYIAKKNGFYPIGELDYTYNRPMVYGYTFASIALQRHK